MVKAVALSPSIEEYLESIYRLQERDGVARTKKLAEMTNVTLGTITNTIESLERRGFVKHLPYKGVRLTKEGETIAIDVIRRHRLVERLLTDILKMEWSKVHEAACKLEHGLTEELAMFIRKSLGYPKTCPHGNSIPTRKGSMVKDKSKPLTSLRPADEGRIVKIVEESSSFLKFLSRQGLVIGARVRVKHIIRSGNSDTILLEGIEHPLEGEMGRKIWVEKT
ncbi:MAG: metal-dependent transcriptional regulator [Candidatus Bathyarchaeia archaeon]